MNRDLSKIQKQYNLDTLDEKIVSPDPFVQFDIWMKKAIEIDPYDASAMVLSTVSEDGKPSSRIVLLKHYSKSGFVFFTNYESRKGAEIEKNSYVCLNFYWKELERQVRIEGKITKADNVVSDQYFDFRPADSKIATIASNQSRIIPNRKVLEAKYEEIKAGDRKLKRPENWGGYVIIPDKFEYWQGRLSRLNDRVLYELDDKGEWKIFRLAP
ncbi:MAG: pyridoxamine 5'-phosphate oxidase [Hyphomicrobiales bacterium]